MWNYTDKVMDHFHNPRNVGRIEEPDGVGQVGALACGDALTLMFKLGGDGRIEDVKFQTFGCASAIASASALTEMIKGKTLEEARRISNRDIAEFLGGLPEQKMHCSVMGREALEAAIHNCETGETTVRTLDDDPVVCHCFDLHKSEIIRVAKENSLADAAQVTNFCKAGGACGKCLGDIQLILDELAQSRRAAAAAAAAAAERPMTQMQKIRKIDDIIEREVRPILKRDGGDLELIDVRGDQVLIAFRGACAGCASAHITRKELIQAKLREFVHPAITVVEE